MASTKSKKILMIIGDMGDNLETFYAAQVLDMFGHECVSVCPDKKKGDYTQTVCHDFESFQTYTEKQAHRFVLTGTFDEIKVEEFDGLVLPGGRAPEYLRLNEKVIKMIQHFGQTNKPIASICHGVQLLAAAGMIKGKKITCFDGCKTEVISNGGEFISGDARVDGNLVTGFAWPANAKIMKLFLELLGNKIN